MLDLGPEIEELNDELTAALLGVLNSGSFVGGPAVAGFEAEAAEFLGAGYAVGVNSGTDALVIGLRALGVQPGDQVITTPFSFFATAEAISVIGAQPVFVDIEPVSFNIDPNLIEQAVTDRTSAIIPVHLYGQPADMATIMEVAQRHDLRVLEDVAQAFGAKFGGRKLGTLGDLGAFSFFPSKNLGAYGDAGLIVTNDDETALVARMLRAHGGKDKYSNEMVGYNSRLDAMQAAVLSVKLKALPRFTDGRRRAAARYDEALAEVRGLAIPAVANGDHVYHQYTVRIFDGRRDLVQKQLAESGVASMVYYPTPIHQLAVYSGQYGAMPEAERAAAEVLSLPIWPQLDEATQERICQAVRTALS
jgi:dTDP-4-amino-4,6-dideoxygalactose transaminase